MVGRLASWIPRIRELSQVKGVIQRIAEVKNRQIFGCGVLLVAPLIMIQYAASITGVQHGGPLSPTNFNRGDGFHAYFVFQDKMRQTACLGPDPFSGRRLRSSLGG